jgi:nucleoid DNA-binding protein
MKRLVDVSREAGIDQIECPRCQTKFTTAELFKRLFVSIINACSSGEKVNVAQFGIFRAVTIKGGREVRSPLIPDGVVSQTRVAMKWRMSANVRRILNPSKADPKLVQKARDARERSMKNWEPIEQERLREVVERKKKAGSRGKRKKRST